MQYQDRLGRNQSMRRYSSAVVERKLAYNSQGGLRTVFKENNLEVQKNLPQPSLLLIDTPQKEEDNLSQLNVSFDFEPLNLVGDPTFVKADKIIC